MKGAFCLNLICALFLTVQAQRLDEIPGLNRLKDSQLERFLQASAEWLHVHANSTKYPQLHDYASYLQQVLKPACTQCTDYYEAVALLRGLSKSIKQILEEDRDGTHYPVVRRSYVAAVWLLQRSKMFLWESTHLSSTTASTLYRMYVSHAHRAYGRTISFHHISKCGGTTMCQLAAANRCSNPHLTMDGNCVMDDRVDGPLWMVAHKVSNTGVYPENVTGVLDVSPDSPIDRDSYNRHEYATEPLLSMWLMYACPYQLNGKLFGCGGRKSMVENTGTTFMANERALSFEHGQSQVCPDFLNAVILREPVPHVISLLAEVRFRYERQLAVKNITVWQPPSWNLTWWESLGPALVGNYATRSLIGRESFCRSAGNMGKDDLSAAVKALLGFDMVMTLTRTKDIDVLVTAMLGWTARNFSSQPATRVRAVPPPARPLDMFGTRQVPGTRAANSTDSVSSSNIQQGALAVAVGKLNTVAQAAAVKLSLRSLLSTAAQPGQASAMAMQGSMQAYDSQGHSTSYDSSYDSQSDRGSSDWGDDSDMDEEEGDDEENEFDKTAAAFDEPVSDSFDESQALPAVPDEVLEAQAATALVRNSHLQRQAQQLGYANISAAGRTLREPRITHLGRHSQYGSHLVESMFNDSTEMWHAFPKHAFAFTASDMARLESLTMLDAQLFDMADVMLDLDVAWLKSLLMHSQYRKKVLAVAHTYTACGFAGILPIKEQQRQLAL